MKDVTTAQMPREAGQPITPRKIGDQQKHLTVAPETEVITDNADGNAAPDMQQYGWDADSLIAGQRNDPDIKVIVSLLERSTDKPSRKDVELQASDVKSLYTEWPRLAFHSGLLCRQWTELTGRRWKLRCYRIFAETRQNLELCELWHHK